VFGAISDGIVSYDLAQSLAKGVGIGFASGISNSEMFLISEERVTTVSDRLTGRLAGDVRRLDSEVLELSLLLPQWQVDALEMAARGRGLTAGQLIRRLIGNYCATLHAAE